MHGSALIHGADLRWRVRAIRVRQDLQRTVHAWPHARGIPRDRHRNPGAAGGCLHRAGAASGARRAADAARRCDHPARTTEPPKDSALEVTSGGILGNLYVSIFPGKDKAMLPPGGMILKSCGAEDVMAMIGRVGLSNGQGGCKRS